MFGGFPDDYTVRRYRGTPDHAVIAGVFNAHATGAGLDDFRTADEIDNQYAHFTHCDLETDLLLVDDLNANTVAYGRIEWWDVDDEKRVYAGMTRLDPEHHAIAGDIVRWCEHRIEEIASGHGATLPKVIWSWSEEPPEGETPRGMTAAYRDMGYRTLTYEAVMVRPNLLDIPDTPLPDGLEVRPVEPAHLRAIWEAHQEAFKDHWGWSEPTEEDYQRFLGFPHRDESLWQVAWAGDEVAGQVRTFISDEENAALQKRRGWTEFISTSRAWRRKGVARALICRSLRDLAERNLDEAALGVHVENPNGAFGLYESLGYRRTALEATYEKPLRF